MRSCTLTLVLLALGGAAHAQAAASAEPDANAVLAALPFMDADGKKHIVIDLAPEGNARRMPFQLDTAPRTRCVSPLLARSWASRGIRSAAAAYQRKTMLGRDLQFYVDTKRSDTGSSSGLEFGPARRPLLAEYVVERDFAGRRVRSPRPERFEVPAKASTAESRGGLTVSRTAPA